MDNILEIKKGFFRSAGNVYKWTKDHHVFGIGIEKHWFREPTVNIKVEGELYTLDSKKAIDFINFYKSYETRQGRRLGIVSKDLLEKVDKLSPDLFSFSTE
jgi:hypothetical protein